MLGDHDVKKKEGEEKHINVCGIKIHSLYKPGPVTLHDIALLELCEPVEYTDAIKPIALAWKRLVLPKSTPVVVAGWGALVYNGKASPLLRKVTVRTIQRSTCKNTFSWLTNGQLCAGIENFGGKDSCKGDSGGALFTCKNSADCTQIGIVSWGIGCAQAQYPGVYTRVTEMIDWIQRITSCY